MAKITLNNIVSGFASQSLLDSNFDAIESEFNDKVLYRDNPTGEANQMENLLDMNSNSIINLPNASSPSEPATYGQLTSATGQVQFTGTSVETQTATAAQTVFTLLTTTYTPGASNLVVHINGIRQQPSAYLESSTTVITFSEGLEAADVVLFTVNERQVDTELVPATSVTVTVDGQGTNVSDQLNKYNEGSIGAVDRSVHSRLRDRISVKDFGAVGDGVTDDTAAVMAAITAIPSSEFVLYFPAGEYIVNNTMDFTNKWDFSLVGDGWGASSIIRTDGTFGDTALFSRTDPTSDVAFGITVRDLQFNAQVDVESDAILHLKNVQRFNCQSVYIKNCHIGIHTEGVRDSRFDNIEITSNGFHTVTRPTSAHLVIDDPLQASTTNTETTFSNFNFTTAQGQVDLEHSVWIRGEFDGLWFNNGHTFGGNASNWLIDGTGQSKFQGLRVNDVYIDQFTDRNIIYTGAAVDKYRNHIFSNCRIFGGTVTNITVNSVANIFGLSFIGCEIGTTQGQGCQVAGGEVFFKDCFFKGVNQSITANGYAIQTTSGAAAGTVLSVLNCDFEMSNLTYGVQCTKTSLEYHLNGNTFWNQDGAISDEILFSALTYLGTCHGNSVNRSLAGDVPAAATLTMSNIATNSINLTGTTASLTTLRPRWHGRRVTIKADSANQDVISGGNMRNKANASPVTILAADMATYEYREDTNRWHEL